MEEQTELLNIYNILKDEIGKFDKKNDQLLVLLIASTGTILTLGFNKEIGPERSWIFLCVYIFIIPIFGILYGNRQHIWKISTYLRVFVEPKLKNISWETRLHNLVEIAPDNNKMKYKSRVIKNEFNFIIGLNIIVLSALIINLVKAFIEKVDFYEIINSLIPTIIGVIVLLLYLRKSRNAITELKRNGIVETNYYKSWYKLKKEEQKKNKKNNNTLSYLTKFLRYLKIFTNSFRRRNSFPRTIVKPK